MDIVENDVDLPKTKEKRNRVSTEISDRKKLNAFPKKDSDHHNSEVWSAFLGSRFSGSQSSRLKKRDSTEIFDRKKFIAVLEEDSDHNLELWSAFTSSRSSLPKKGDLVFYFPQGHLEYEKPPDDLLDLTGDPGQLLPVPGPPGQPPKKEVRTYDLQPQILCRVEHVQLMIRGADDDIYAEITLCPEPEVNSEEKELEQSDEIEDYTYEADGRPATISTLEPPDSRLLLSIPPKAAIEIFCLDKESMDLQNEVTAKDFHGSEWKFSLIRDQKEGNWLLRWTEFARARNVEQGDRAVFLREKDTKLIRFGIIRGFPIRSSARIDDPLSEAAGAILKKSIFSVMFRQRSDHEDFVIPYQKYMKSITRPGFIGAKVHMQYGNSSTRFTGEVTGMADLDPKNWPNSMWKCLLVTWVKSSYEVLVSPWEIVFDDSPSPSFDSSWINEVILPRRQGSAVMYRKEMPQTNKGPWTSTFIYKESKLKKLQTGVPWTEEEHRLFLIGLQKLGKGDWRGIARNYVISRTPTQVASHAQKYFTRQSNATRRKRRSSLFDLFTEVMATDTPSVPEEQILHPSPLARETDNSSSIPSLNLSLNSEFEPMEAVAPPQETVKEPEESASGPNEFKESAFGSNGYTQMMHAFYPGAYMPVPYAYWPPNAASREEEEDKEAENCNHQILKPIPILPKEPENVDELVGMSHLSIVETAERRYREPSPLSLKLLGEPSRQSAFHANAPVSNPDLSNEKHKDLLSDEAIRSEKQKHVQEPGSIHCEADTTNHPFDIQKQTPAPQTSSQLTLCPDLCSLTSFSESKSTTNYEELKISNCSVDDLWRHLKENHSYEYLEFDSCSFPSSTRIPIPVTIKKLKITNCVDTEQVFTVLMDPNLSVESLEIDSCSSFSSMSTGGIPATLGQLKIVNCMNLNSLSESFETEKSPINERVHYSMADILDLRKLEIQNCQKLESLPKGLHKLRNLDLLSINDCCSLEYFPEGGLPITCLTSLSISGCENLKCLPNKLHKVTSLQNLSISGCPSLMLFPEGGLPPNLVSLRIIDCENLISLSQWELHRLKHLRKYSFSCGCSDSEE